MGVSVFLFYTYTLFLLYIYIIYMYITCIIVMYVYIYTCMYTHIQTYQYRYRSFNIHVHLHVHLHIHIYILMYMYIYIYVVTAPHIDFQGGRCASKALGFPQAISEAWSYSKNRCLIWLMIVYGVFVCTMMHMYIMCLLQSGISLRGKKRALKIWRSFALSRPT